MKVGDYVLVEDEGVGKITLVAFHPKYHLVWLLEGSNKFAVLRHEERMTPLDPAVSDILIAVKTNEEEQNGII